MATASRRGFLGAAGVAAGAWALPRFAIGNPATADSRKLSVAVVGVSGMGGYATSLAAQERMAALCDVDEQRAAGVYKKHPDARFMELKPELAKIPKLPDVGSGPIEEWYRAIKGEGPAPGSSFEYAGPLTEMVLLGALAQRFGKTIEWDAAAMQAKGLPELEPYIREPAREGWRYGETL